MSNRKRKLLWIGIAGGIIALSACIAGVTRLSLVVASPDLSYIRVGPYVHPSYQDMDEHYAGKAVVGESGFPFSTYAKCQLGYHGERIGPACDELSWCGEWSILLNILFWSSLFGGIALAVNLVIKRRHAGKPHKLTQPTVKADGENASAK